MQKSGKKSLTELWSAVGRREEEMELGERRRGVRREGEGGEEGVVVV